MHRPRPSSRCAAQESRCGRRRAEADSKRLDWLAGDTTTGSQLTACSQTGGLQMHCVPRQALNPSVPVAQGRWRTRDVGVGGVDQAQQRGVLAVVLQEPHEAAIGGRRGRGRGRRGRRGGRGGGGGRGGAAGGGGPPAPRARWSSSRSPRAPRRAPTRARRRRAPRGRRRAPARTRQSAAGRARLHGAQAGRLGMPGL